MTLPAPKHAPGGAPCALPGSPLDRAREGLEACVHCGFCLPACPTYLALEDENDSPRGRLVLMGALLDGRLAPDDPALMHIDRCLGCRGCETACPSGVPYGALLEATRETVAAHRGLGWRARLVLAVFAREWLLRPALALARVVRDLGLARLMMRVLPRTIAMPAAMLASTARPRRRSIDGPATASATSTDAPKGTAALLTGCVMEGLLAPLNRDTERVLAAHGWRLVPVRDQRCCGALHAHAGDGETARALAKANIAAFERSGAETIVMNSAGCGSMCKEYGHLLAEDGAWAERAKAFSAKVRDVSELLAPLLERVGASAPSGARDTSSRPPVQVAWDAPCHLQHAQRLALPPLVMLRAVRGAVVTPLTDGDLCCGSAGIFTLTQPQVSAAVLAPKLERIAASGADIVATSNPGCLMQVGGGLLLEGRTTLVRHPVELLAGSMDGPIHGAPSAG